MKKIVVVISLVVSCIGVGAAPASTATIRTDNRYTVLFKHGTSRSESLAVLTKLGARVIKENRAIGLVTVRSDRSSFLDQAIASNAFEGVAREHPIGVIPNDRLMIEQPGTMRSRSSHRVARDSGGGEPFSNREWYLDMVDATPSGSYSIDAGDPRVLVGVIDSGIDIKHQHDVATSVDRELSRSFTTDIPAIDGKCSDEADRSCEDSPFSGDNGHGTSVAGIISGDINGFGISGVAPEVTLVSLRAGQDSGYVFLQPVVDALTYAADNGIDVVNMSFYIDPWLVNCPNNPADTPQQQSEQQMVVQATQDAINYARSHNVTPIAAAGNNWLNLDDPTEDETSPDYGADPHHRDTDNTCKEMPAEADGVIGVSGLGPSERKAYYSSYGLEGADVSAPGGDRYDTRANVATNQLFIAWSKRQLVEVGVLTRSGKPKKGSGVVRRCLRSHHRKCSYFLEEEGTSGAAPIAAAVAALIVGRFGIDDGAGGLTLDPATVESKLYGSSVPHACPSGGTQRYPEIGGDFKDFGYTADDFTATCTEGPNGTNGFYGHGIVNALNAVQN